MIILADRWEISYIHSAEFTLAHSTSPTAVAPGCTVSSSDSVANNLSARCTADTNGSTLSPSLLEYTHYMSRLLASEEWTPVSSPAGSSTETSPTFRGKVSPALKLRDKLRLNRSNSMFFRLLCIRTVHLWACRAAENGPYRLGQRFHWSNLLGLPARETLVGRGVPQNTEEAEQNQSA